MSQKFTVECMKPNTNPIESLKNDVKELLSKAELRKAVNKLIDEVQNTQKKNNLMSIRARFDSLEKRYKHEPKTMGYWDYDKEFGSINRDVLDIIRGLESKDVRYITQHNPLFAHEFGELHLYACNRDEHFEKMQSFLNEKEDKEHLHIFIPAILEDAPNSFVTRIKYELLKDYHAPAIKTQSNNRIFQMQPLTLELKKNVAKAIYDVLTEHVHTPVVEGIFLFFQINVWNCSSSHVDELMTRLNTCSWPGYESKKIRFFYWLNTGSKKPNGIWNSIKNITKTSLHSRFKQLAATKQHIFVMEHLPELDKGYIYDWLSDHFSQQADADRDKIVEEIFSQKNKLRMSSFEQKFYPYFSKNYHDNR